MSAKKIDCFKYGRDIGKMEVILLYLLQEAIEQKNIEEMKEVQENLDLLLSVFEEKLVKRTFNLTEEILQLQKIYKQLRTILKPFILGQDN
jgi:hypothetical protein